MLYKKTVQMIVFKFFSKTIRGVLYNLIHKPLPTNAPFPCSYIVHICEIALFCKYSYPNGGPLHKYTLYSLSTYILTEFTPSTYFKRNTGYECNCFCIIKWVNLYISHKKTKNILKFS